MARRGKFDHLKPEILRLLAEGLSQAEIRKQYPDIPKGTLSLWANLPPVQKCSELRSETPRPRLPIDPESPIEKIKHALWDIVYNPEGKGAAVQALNILLKIEAPWIAGGGTEPPSDDDSNEVKVTRKVVDAQGA
jgi:hypothetical protein